MTVRSVATHDGAVIQIVLDRARVHNALDAPTLDALQAAFDSADRAGARVIVLRGEGRSFSSGADRRAYPGYSGEGAGQGRIHADITIGNRVCRAIAECNAITIARLHGHVLGGGLAIALACDIVYAGTSASFIQAFSKIGLIPDSGGTFFLPRLIGFQRASALTMLGDKVSAAEAVTMGMIYKAVDDAQLMETAIQTSQTLAGLPTKALGASWQNRSMQQKATIITKA